MGFNDKLKYIINNLKLMKTCTLRNQITFVTYNNIWLFELKKNYAS